MILDISQENKYTETEKEVLDDAVRQVIADIRL